MPQLTGHFFFAGFVFPEYYGAPVGMPECFFWYARMPQLTGHFFLCVGLF